MNQVKSMFDFAKRRSPKEALVFFVFFMILLPLLTIIVSLLSVYTTPIFVDDLAELTGTGYGSNIALLVSQCLLFSMIFFFAIMRKSWKRLSETGLLVISAIPLVIGSWAWVSLIVVSYLTTQKISSRTED